MAPDLLAKERRAANDAAVKFFKRRLVEGTDVVQMTERAPNALVAHGGGIVGRVVRLDLYSARFEAAGTAHFADDKDVEALAALKLRRQFLPALGGERRNRDQLAEVTQRPAVVAKIGKLQTAKIAQRQLQRNGLGRLRT